MYTIQLFNFKVTLLKKRYQSRYRIVLRRNVSKKDTLWIHEIKYAMYQFVEPL